MVEVFDRTQWNKLTGILENAFNVVEDECINGLNQLAFSLPRGDPKNALCQAFHYVRYNNGQLYRILPEQVTVAEEGHIRYSCEHVLAMLIDSILYGQHVVGNAGMFTPLVIKWVLDKQDKRFDPWQERWTVEPQRRINWTLGRCDFNHQFEYGWSQETLLSAIFSIATPFTEKFMWTFNTHVYPFVLNLIRLNENGIPEVYIRGGRNRIQLVKRSDPTTLATRLYPLGEGEGINQLTIRDANNGVAFIESPPAVVERYGLIERAWIDRRYTCAQSLLDAGQAVLAELQEPFEEFEVDFADVGAGAMEQIGVGKLVEVVGFKRTFVTGVQWNHEEIPKSKLHIANRPRDIAGTIADLADRQRIEATYAQGATQFFERDSAGNCSTGIPLRMNILIPEGLKIINFVMLDVQMGPFEMPFDVTANFVRTSSIQTSTNSSIANIPSPGAGRWSTLPLTDASWTSTIFQPFARTENARAGFAAGPSGFTVENALGHSHNIWSINAHHQHRMPEIPHTHDFTHTHNITLPDLSHNHQLTPAMRRIGNPTSFRLRVNGREVQTVTGRELNRDITEWLVDETNKIPRGRYIRIEIIPNEHAHVIMTVSVQGFTQSRGNKTV